MKARATLIQGSLAVAGLVAAWATWQRPRETRAMENGVVLVSASKTSLGRVHFEDGTRFVDLVRTTEGTPRLVVTQGFLPGKTPPPFDAGQPLDAGVLPDGGLPRDAGTPPLPPPEPPPTREMFAGERAEALWTRFSPLEAQRSLGVLPADKLKELGFEGSERKLELTVNGAARGFTVAKPLPGVFGSYLLDSASGEVSLLQGSFFTELDPAGQNLVDRRLHTFKTAEIDRFAVSVDGASAEFVVSDAAVPTTMKVASAKTPQAPDELLKNWYEKTWNKVVITEVLGKGELPRAGVPEVRLRLELSSRGAVKGWLEIGYLKNHGTWARSENTAGWVAVHQSAEEFMLEAQKLIADAKAP